MSPAPSNPDHAAILADALARLQAVDPRIRGQIVGDVLHLAAPGITAEQASAVLFQCVHPLRAPKGCAFRWEEVQQ